MEWEIFSVNSLFLSFVLVFDFFSFLFSWVVLIIATSIFFFGQYYIDTDKFQKGFASLLFLFVVSIFFLIFRPNIFSLLLGWDGLGLVSYLLVVYYIRYSRATAGIVTFLTNRVGDVFFLLSIFLLGSCRSWDFFVIKTVSYILPFTMIVTFITKRAQIPFSSWLPAAIAAPTPVSSLVHSSTLVTAGVFLLVRFNLSITLCFSVLFVLSIITIIIAGFMANFEWDIKKLIAYSTLSQLGFMVVSLSLKLVFFCFFHLLCHALFKASLFIISGVIIHNMDSRQDYRNRINFSSSNTPLLSVGVCVCVLCLCGFPFLTGFFSKDIILDGASLGAFFFFLFFFSVSLTISYSLRFAYYSIKTGFSLRLKLISFYDSVGFLVVPVWVLISFSIFIGFFWIDYLRFYILFFSFFCSFWKIFYLFFFFFVVVATFFLFRIIKLQFFLKKYFFSSIWFLNRIVGYRLGQSVFWFGGHQTVIVDQGWSEIGGPQGIYNRFSFLSFFFFRDQRVGVYLFFLPFLFFLIFKFW